MDNGSVRARCRVGALLTNAKMDKLDGGRVDRRNAKTTNKEHSLYNKMVRHQHMQYRQWCRQQKEQEMGIVMSANGVYQRKCPQCNDIISYVDRHCMMHAIRHHTACCKCAVIKRIDVCNRIKNLEPLRAI